MMKFMLPATTFAASQNRHAKNDYSKVRHFTGCLSKHNFHWDNQGAEAQFLKTWDGVTAVVHCVMPGEIWVRCDDMGMEVRGKCPEVKPTNIKECIAASEHLHKWHNFSFKNHISPNLEHLILDEDNPLKAKALCKRSDGKIKHQNVECKLLTNKVEQYLNNKSKVTFVIENQKKMCLEANPYYWYTINSQTYEDANGSQTVCFSGEQPVDGECSDNHQCEDTDFDDTAEMIDRMIEEPQFDAIGNVKLQALCKYATAEPRTRGVICDSVANKLKFEDAGCPKCDDSILKKDRYLKHLKFEMTVDDSTDNTIGYMIQCKYGGYVEMKCVNGTLQLADENKECPACEHPFHPWLTLEWHKDAMQATISSEHNKLHVCPAFVMKCAKNDDEDPVISESDLFCENQSSYEHLRNEDVSMKVDFNNTQLDRERANEAQHDEFGEWDLRHDKGWWRSFELKGKRLAETECEKNGGIYKFPKTPSEKLAQCTDPCCIPPHWMCFLWYSNVMAPEQYCKVHGGPHARFEWNKKTKTANEKRCKCGCCVPIENLHEVINRNEYQSHVKVKVVTGGPENAAMWMKVYYNKIQEMFFTNITAVSSNRLLLAPHVAHTLEEDDVAMRFVKQNGIMAAFSLLSQELDKHRAESVHWERIDRVLDDFRIMAHTHDPIAAPKD